MIHVQLAHIVMEVIHLLILLVQLAIIAWLAPNTLLNILAQKELILMLLDRAKLQTALLVQSDISVTKKDKLPIQRKFQQDISLLTQENQFQTLQTLELQRELVLQGIIAKKELQLQLHAQLVLTMMQEEQQV